MKIENFSKQELENELERRAREDIYNLYNSKSTYKEKIKTNNLKYYWVYYVTVDDGAEGCSYIINSEKKQSNKTILEIIKSVLNTPGDLEIYKISINYLYHFQLIEV